MENKSRKMAFFGPKDRMALTASFPRRLDQGRFSTDQSRLTTPMRRAKRGAGFGVITLVFSVIWVLFAVPASAAPSISVTPDQGLNPDGDFVSVTGSGFEPNSQIFVMQCRSTSGDDHTCNSVGLQKVTTDAAGNFQRSGVKVTSRFGATDCFAVPCAIKTSAVAGHADDRAFDVYAFISFGADAVGPNNDNDGLAQTETTTPNTVIVDETTTTEMEAETESAETEEVQLMAASSATASSDGGLSPVLVGFIIVGLASGVVAGTAVAKRRHPGSHEGT